MTYTKLLIFGKITKNPNKENLTRREIELERELHEKKKLLKEQEKNIPFKKKCTIKETVSDISVDTVSCFCMIDHYPPK